MKRLLFLLIALLILLSVLALSVAATENEYETAALEEETADTGHQESGMPTAALLCSFAAVFLCCIVAPMSARRRKNGNK